MGSGSSLTSRDLGSAAQVERRTRILDTTIELATNGGVEAGQMRSAAEQAGVAPGTLYRYFPSKIHLLVSALSREFDAAAERLSSQRIPGDTAAERVINVLRRITGGLQDRDRLAEALTRAFMFADKSAEREIQAVGQALTSMLTHAMHPERDGGAAAASEEDLEIARVIGDVWLSSLVSWISGRSSAADTARHMERAVRLILR